LPGFLENNASYLHQEFSGLEIMGITHDEATGWVEGGAQPRWRSTTAAFRRLHDASVYWHTGAHGVVTAHLETGTPVVVIRRYLAHKR
jgi:hypothetical protein